MKLYFPESSGQVDFVGYNHLCKLFNKALSDYLTNDPMDAIGRIYCNLPWHHAPRTLRVCGLPIIAYTMYEATHLPKAWISFLNTAVDKILVPSAWCKSIFVQNGIYTPIMVLSPGIDTDVFKPVSKTQNTDKYVFLWQGVAFDRKGRKGFDCVMDAFIQLKREGRLKDDAMLIVKCRPHPNYEWTVDVKNGDGIHFIQDNFPRNKMMDLYKSVDCCVNPTHGEGFGFIPLEQMAMGKPVIVTSWSMDYIDPQYCLPVSYELKTSDVIWNHKYLRVGLNGISYNLSGLSHAVEFWPKKMKPIPDGEKVVAFMGIGREFPKINIGQRIVAKIHNALSGIQEQLHLFPDPRRKSVTIFQEYPGQDAFINIEDLKKKMEWCYLNRDNAEDIGFMASEYVQRNWSLEHMRDSFEEIKPQLLEKE